MTGILAIDLGKTSCRAALWRDGAREDAAGPGAPGLAAADGVALAAEAVLAVAGKLCRAEAGSGVGLQACIGAAGALIAPEAARDLARRLLHALPLARIGVTSDAVTAHAGALGLQPGIVLSAGTGAVAVAIGWDQGLVRIDGHGPWLGDEGGGAWLGLGGLRAALRAAEGRGPATRLQEAAFRRYGPPDALAAAVGGDPNPARAAAAFAADVVQAAAEGDAVAEALLTQAAEALAGTVAAAARRRPGPAALAVIGGLLHAWPDLPARLVAALHSAAIPVRLQPAQGTALEGARLLAHGGGPAHQALLHVAIPDPPAQAPPDPA